MIAHAQKPLYATSRKSQLFVLIVCFIYLSIRQTLSGVSDEGVANKEKCELFFVITGTRLRRKLVGLSLAGVG